MKVLRLNITNTIKNLLTKAKVEHFHLQLESHVRKTVIDFNFGRHKDLSTLKSDIHLDRKAEMNITFKGRYILMSASLKPIVVYYQRRFV